MKPSANISEYWKVYVKVNNIFLKYLEYLITEIFVLIQWGLMQKFCRCLQNHRLVWEKSQEVRRSNYSVIRSISFPTEMCGGCLWRHLRIHTKNRVEFKPFRHKCLSWLLTGLCFCSVYQMHKVHNHKVVWSYCWCLFKRKTYR